MNFKIWNDLQRLCYIFKKRVKKQQHKTSKKSNVNVFPLEERSQFREKKINILG